MPFILPTLLSFQGSTRLFGVGSFSKYLLYHEMLHRDNPKHDASFRNLEHRFPDWEQCDHFLDCTMNQFDIKEW